MHVTVEEVIACGTALNFIAVILSHVFHNQKFAQIASNASKEVEQHAPQIVAGVNEAVGVAQDLSK